METALILFVLTFATIGVGAMAVFHFMPYQLHDWIDWYHQI